MKQLTIYRTHLLVFLMIFVAKFMVVSGASIENNRGSAASSTSIHRRPPFNGSIFGKRSGSGSSHSFIRANSPSISSTPTVQSMLQPMVSNLENGLGSFRLEPSPVELLAQFLEQQEPLVRASLRQCTDRLYVSQQLVGQRELNVIDDLCAEMLGNSAAMVHGSKPRIVEVLNQLQRVI